MDGRARVSIVFCNCLLRESIAPIPRKKAELEIIAAHALAATCRNEIVDSGAVDPF
jgi:hypothetical protein